MDTFKTMEGERIEQLERDKVALMADIQELKRENKRLSLEVDKEKNDQQWQRSMKHTARRQRDVLIESLAKIKADAIRDAVSLYTHKMTDEFCEVQVGIIKKRGGFLYPEGLIDYANKLEEGLQDEIE